MSLGVQQLLPHRLLEENQSQHSVNVELPCILAVGFSRRSLTYHKLTTTMLLAPAVAPCTLFSNRNEDSVRTYQIVLLLGSESFCLTQSKSLSPYDGFQALSVLGPSTPTPISSSPTSLPLANSTRPTLASSPFLQHSRHRPT